MDEVKGVIVSYDFEFAWDRISTSSMNEETTCVAHIGHSFVFFATKGLICTRRMLDKKLRRRNVEYLSKNSRFYHIGAGVLNNIHIHFRLHFLHCLGTHWR